MPASFPDPGIALAWFALLCVGLAVLGWPGRGVVPRAIALARVNERVRLEDALKHLYTAEYEGTPGSAESVAGALQVSRLAATRLLERLESMGLVTADSAGFPLTADGRAYALRVLRVHRLWERYLADRTGVKPEEWHDHAERQEHALTADATEALAASLGYPLYDPHGDPIPGASGEMPPRRGLPLTALGAGDNAIIAHLEDEPRESYQQLVAARLAPRQSLEVLDSGPGTVRLRTPHGEYTLPRIVAKNVTVERRPATAKVPESWLSLAALRAGEQARVVGISPACQGAERRRLLDLGVVPGTIIRAEFQGAAGGPMAYRIRGALIALRAEQAEHVQAERVPQEQLA